ncbi:MAG TPA: hypothetical protein VH853_17405 [Polyangia bacterium]|jgi:hypothetical protein|nr:hypothetical protein [Polyangia bacterium]
MKRHNGTLWLAVAAALLSPSKARAQAKGTARAAAGGPPQRQGRRQVTRRPQALAPVVSPCGRHVVEVTGGAVLIDGRRVHSADDNVFVVAPPTWRRDGSALAWIERSRGEARLVVVPDLDGAPDPLPWTLPAVSTDDRVFWAGQRRVVVGPAVLSPRAIATWSE